MSAEVFLRGLSYLECYKTLVLLVHADDDVTRDGDECEDEKQNDGPPLT